MQFLKSTFHAETEGMQVIKGNKHLLEKHPNMYQHEIAMMSEENPGDFLYWQSQT